MKARVKEPGTGAGGTILVSGPARVFSVMARLSGPGALYNTGNVLAIGSGVAISAQDAWGAPGFGQAVLTQLFGSPGATWVTVAILIFILSGDLYRRAFRAGASLMLVTWADFLSGVAALVLTVALVILGDTAAALLGGLMLAAGKFGSALLPFLRLHRAARLDRVLRLMVVASRVPSILALVLVVWPAILGEVPLDTVLMSLVMIVCFFFWLAADLVLIRRG